MGKYLKEFVGFHGGIVNRLIHLVGFAIVGLGIVEKNIVWVVVGGVTQELGHFYQYAKTGKPQDNPWHGLRSQSIFAFPIFIAIVVYVLVAK